MKFNSCHAYKMCIIVNKMVFLLNFCFVFTHLDSLSIKRQSHITDYSDNITHISQV